MPCIRVKCLYGEALLALVSVEVAGRIVGGRRDSVGLSKIPAVHDGGELVGDGDVGAPFLDEASQFLREFHQ